MLKEKTEMNLRGDDMKVKKIALVMGDGAAPEMMEQACKVAIKAAEMDRIKIVFVETSMGWNAFEEYGDTLPPESLKKVLELGIVFFGAVGDPKHDNTIGAEKPEMKPEARVLLALRSQMGLLLNFRPMIYYGNLAHIAQVRPERIPKEGIKQTFVRFLLEDSYFGNEDLWDLIPEYIRRKLGVKHKKDITGKEDIVTDFAYYRRSTVEKYYRAVFSYARQAKLPVVIIDKSNIMPRYVFWRKIAERIGREEFPDVPYSCQYVDAANALLFDPTKLQGVIACGNEHGDIISDGGAAACGGLGLMHSWAVNPDTIAAMFESGAGTAPTLVGKDQANPLGRILAGADMLRHIGAVNGAKAIEEAVNVVLRSGWRTLDLLGKTDDFSKVLGTRAIGEKVLSHLKE